MTLSEELTWRGFVNQTTYKDLTILDKGSINFYWGVDPSASSMHIGNLAAAIMVKIFIKHGHKAFLLVGGATGMIGDPDGKSEERSLKTIDEVALNKAAITKQYRQLFPGKDIEIVDNYEWFKKQNYLDFLRDVGKHVPLRQMLARDFVQSRVGEKGSGISYAEFSYVLIQAYDFLRLYKDKSVTLQLCGSDQWGNSIAGVDLIRRITGGEANVFSSPLIINNQSGRKFGKSETDAVWLDASLTSAYQFYQFWLNTDDQDVEGYLKIFTEIEKEEFSTIMDEFKKDHGGRAAQKKLAYEVTKFIHGPIQADKQVNIAEAISRQDISALNDTELGIIRQEIAYAKSAPNGSIIDALVACRLAESNTEARRLISSLAIAINGQKIARQQFEKTDFVKGRLLLRRGKAFKDSALIEIV